MLLRLFVRCEVSGHFEIFNLFLLQDKIQMCWKKIRPPAGPCKAIVAESTIAVKCAFQNFQFLQDDFVLSAHIFFYDGCG